MNLFQVTKKQPSGGLEIKTATGDIASFETHYSEPLPAPFNNLNVKCTIVASGGGGTPSTPIPIVGHSELNLVRCGKNLLPNCNSKIYTVNSVTVTCNEDGTFTSSGTTTGGSFLYDYQMIQNLNIISGMYLHCNNDFNSTTLVFGFRFTDGTGVDFTLSSNNRIIDLSSYVGKNVNKIRIYGANGTVMNGTLKPMVLTVNTPTPYEPYHGTPYLVQFGQTVYGGELDVTTGVLTITHGIFTIDGNTNMSPNGSTANTSHFVIAIPNKAYGYDNFISDKFAYLTPYQDIEGYASGRINSSNIEFFLPSSVAQTMAAGKAWFANNVTTIVYELATPIEIDVSELSVDTIVGVNNVFADTGSVEVKYLDVV